MKKITKILTVLLCCVLCMPLLVACNGKYTTELQSVLFTQDEYQADEGQSIELKYKTYPSTAQNYKLSFEVSGIKASEYSLDTSSAMFQFKTGSTSNQATVKIIYGGGENDYTTCRVIKKQYPTEIYFTNANDDVISESFMNKNSSRQLRLVAKMQDGTTKVIDKRDYNIELTSSAPNIISVDNRNMMATSTGIIGSATLTAKIVKLSGGYCGVTNENPQGYSAQIKLSVIENISKAKVSLTGMSGFLDASTTRTQTSQNTYNTNLNSITCSFSFYSKNNERIDSSLIKVELVSSNSSFATITKNSNGTFKITILQEEGLSCISIVTDASRENGDPVQFLFYIQK